MAGLISKANDRTPTHHGNQKMHEGLLIPLIGDESA